MSYRWRTARDGGIELDRGDGRGYVRPALGSHGCITGALRWRALADKYGGLHGVPPAWILANVAVESCGVPTAENFCCVGLLAIYLAVHRKSRADMIDPDQNLDYGTSLLAASRRRGLDFVQATSVHNAGSLPDGSPHPSASSPWGLRENKGHLERAVEALNELVGRGVVGTQPSHAASAAAASLAGSVVPFGLAALVSFFVVRDIAGALR